MVKASVSAWSDDYAQSMGAALSYYSVFSLAPFLLIDLIVSSILMAMGMLMVPPMMISLPLKVLMFILIDGWNLVVGSLLESFR